MNGIHPRRNAPRPSPIRLPVPAKNTRSRPRIHADGSRFSLIQLLCLLLGAVAGAHALVLGLAGAAAGAGFDGDAGQRAMILLLAVIGAGAYSAADIRIGRLLVHDEFLLKINLGSGFSMPGPTKIIQKNF